MSIKDKILASINQSKEVPEKLSQKYREHLGEEIVKKQEQLAVLEAELIERKKNLDERESTLNHYYQIPKRLVQVPVFLATIMGGILVYQQLSTSFSAASKARVSRVEEVRSPSVEEDRTPSSSECYRKGIAYYKDLGSYPRFSTGEDTESEVRLRCQRSNGMAFGK